MRYVLDSRLPIEEARSIWQDIRTVQIELHSVATLADDAFSLALENMGTVYDALYIALAVREDLKVVTADDRMVSAFAKVNRAVTLASFE